MILGNLKLNEIQIKHLKMGFIILVDIIIFILLFPLYLFFIMVLWIHSKIIPKKKSVLFVGLEHVINKSVIRGEFFKNKKFNVLFYSFEKNDKNPHTVRTDQILEISNFNAIDIVKFMLIIIKIKPIYIEVYFEGIYIYQFIYAIIGRIYNTLVIAIIRGELGAYNGNIESRKEMNWLNKFFIRKTLLISNYVLCREPYLCEILEAINIPKRNIFYDPNLVQVSYDNIYYNRKKINILFLNSPKKVRRPELFIESAYRVLKEFDQEICFEIVGVQNESQQNYLDNMITEYSLNNVFKTYKWTSNAKQFYNNAAVYVLPADIVFCNFALLESMERGVPAIVSNVRDADKIIKHGVNGYLVKQTAEDIAKHILLLIKNEDLRLQMGIEARKTIIKDFNDKDRMKPIYNLLLQKYPGIVN